jgi:hypothetical protein
LNKVLVVTALLLTITPLVALSGNTNSPEMIYTPDNFGDAVTVVPGTTIKYTINTLTLPTIENLTIGDLTNNELYVKVTDVQPNYEYVGGVLSNFIWFDIGLIFTTNVAISIGEGFTALDLVIPTGAATPAIGLAGVPHFNLTGIEGPAIFVLDQGWASHTSIFTLMGFSIVTDDVDTLSVSYTENATSFLEMTWRKSDGLLTNLHISDIIFMGLNMDDIEVELTYKEDVFKGITLIPGEEIDLVSDISFLNIEGTGDIFSLLNTTEIDEIESTFTSMEDQTLMRFDILAVEGLYYTADVYAYDLDTQSLVDMGTYEFCAFFGGFQEYGPPPLYEGGVTEYMHIVAPVITTDYDIYTGYMVLLDTIVGVYIDDILALLPDLTTMGITFNTIDGSFTVQEKKGFFYLKNSLDIDMTIEEEFTLIPDYMTIQVSPTISINPIISQEAWIAYHESGYLAGMRMFMSVDVSITSDYSTLVTGMPTGTVQMDLDFKVTNVNYNPPDPIGGGIIPGFTWLISIPAIFSVALIVVIRRKK